MAESLAPVRGTASAVDDLSIALDPTTDLDALARLLGASGVDLPISGEARRGLKFADCLPMSRADEVLRVRLTDAPSVRQVVHERLTSWREEGSNL